MRKVILAVLVLAACAKSDDAAVDTTAATAAEPAAPAMTAAQSMYAGVWNGRSYRAGAPASDTGSTWTMTFTPADTGLTGTLRFSGQTTDIPIRVDEASHSSMRTTFGPYMSPAAGNAEVTTTTEGRMAGDSLFGSFVATPTTGAKVSGRFAARRQ
ncbi:MAG: hypothetical protein H0W42_07230 [Gemmatimonadaceae bacterium]|nr:hypothetical protein [Gemmatimonadaceae bacterium]